MNNKIEKLKNKLIGTRRHCIASLLKILRRHYIDALNDKEMYGNFKEGYLMGLSDAIESIRDEALWGTYKNHNRRK
jgi:hypothetical protein